MGKKSKRSRSSKSAPAAPRAAPALRTKEEDKDDLQFEDDEIEQWEDDDDDDDNVGLKGGEDGDDDDDDEAGDRFHSWHPLMASRDHQVELEMDPSAYKMHHAMQLEWPALSFDFLRDPWGDSRTRFPHSLLVAVGTQADNPKHNAIEILKLTDLAKIHVETEDDILGEEYKPDQADKDDDDDNDNMDSDDEEEDEDAEPLMEHVSIKHYGGVNRLRTMPQNGADSSASIIATWSDVGKVYLYNVEKVVEGFTSSSETTKTTSSTLSPFFIHSGHETEGYALDWSKQSQQQQQLCQLATGDCAGKIHLWTPRPEGGYQVTPTFESMHNGQAMSVEDIQWSPTEATVLATAACGGLCQVYDTRAPHRAMLSHVLTNTTTKHNNKQNKQQEQLGPDLNVLSWNSLVTNLLATGSDNGELCVWDLRQFSSSTQSSTKLAPLARFDSHQSPITSVEWHPTDESMLAATDDFGTYVYDFSVEPDHDDDNAIQGDGILPPQLLFTHCGSTQFKEVHWHEQITSCLMTTALSGLSVFIPCNL